MTRLLRNSLVLRLVNPEGRPISSAKAGLIRSVH